MGKCNTRKQHKRPGPKVVLERKHSSDNVLEGEDKKLKYRLHPRKGWRSAGK